MFTRQVILVAEDNDDDFVLLRCAFETAGLPYRLIGVPDGVEAISYLLAEHPYTRSVYPFPDLMLLDMEMPRLNGMEVLAEVGGRIEFGCLPIVVLSSVADAAVVQRALGLGARDYLVKPVTMADRVEMVRKLDERWLRGNAKSIRRSTKVNSWGLRLPDQERSDSSKEE